MNQKVSIILLVALALSLFGCGSAPTAAPTTEVTAPKPTVSEEPSMLNGKKILFIGNSYTYYGKTVIEKKQSILWQSDRSNDKGYFYQLCKERGAQVEVTNWTFGAHTLDDLFTECAANRGCDGEHHLDHLIDRNFDYVVLQEAGNSRAKDMSAEELVAKCDSIMAIFREANPDVKFVFLVQHMVHKNQSPWLAALKMLDEKGVIIADWGKLVWDVMNRTVPVPGAEQYYDQNSFIVCKSATDGYHPNMLTGYITTLMTYCAITGESAQGQPYDFCGDPGINSKFNFDNFIQSYYIYNNGNTNFPAIFKSETDMLGLQQLIDQYLAEKPYLNY